MNEFWNALLTGLAGSENDKHGRIAFPLVIGLFVLLSFVF